MTIEDLKELLDQAASAEQNGMYDVSEDKSRQILLEIERLSTNAEDLRDASILKANATRILGLLCLRRGVYTEGLELCKIALSLSEQVDDRATVAHTLSNMGLIVELSSSVQEAMEYHEKALSIDIEIDNKSGIARNLSNLGQAYRKKSDYPKALEFFERAKRIGEELGDKATIASCHGGVGTVYSAMSDIPKALEYLLRALSIYEELGNKFRIAYTYGTIGEAYSHLSDYSTALEYFGKAMSIHEELGNDFSYAKQLFNIGSIYAYLSDFRRALECFSEALVCFEQKGNKDSIAITLGNIGGVYAHLQEKHKALDYYTRALRDLEEIGNRPSLANNLSNVGQLYQYLSDYPTSLEYYTKALAINEHLGNKAGVASNLASIGSLYQHMSNYAQALEHLERAHQMQSELGEKNGDILSLMSLGVLYMNSDNPDRNEQRAEEYLQEAIAINSMLGTKHFEPHKNLAALYKQQERWREFGEHLEKYLALKEEVESEDAKNAAAQLEQRIHLKEREQEIAIAKTAADAKLSATTSLLYKVLPEPVATRMIKGDNEIADYYTSVSILFADIAGFTPLSSDMPAIIVVRFLNYVFAEFDRIIKKHGCEKIKTIGDGYMAVCGAPIECSDHAERLAAAAIEMQQTIVLPESIREHLPDNTKLGVRIGLHTGSVVAGVIGEERFVYDIYSDAVNIAARMESHGEEGKIHCSNDFYRHMQNRFAMTKNTTHGLSFVKRGEVEIKGKGMMRTYFMEKA